MTVLPAEFPAMDVAGRIARLRERFDDLQCDAVLVTNLVSVRYLTGFTGSAAFLVARRRTVSLLGAAMRLPSSREIDRRLVIGSMVFGVGWGIAGFCPGPGLVALGMGEAKGLVFVLAMLAGMGIFELIERRGRQP